METVTALETLATEGATALDLETLAGLRELGLVRGSLTDPELTEEGRAALAA